MRAGAPAFRDDHRGPGEQDRADLVHVGEHAGWRSHTFADGVRLLTLIGPLDAALAGRLWTRVSELLDRGCRRLVIDASAIEPTGERCAMLAAVFAGRSVGYQAVVVAPPASELVDLLPTTVGVALSLSDAHGQLQRGAVRRSAAPAAPASRLPATERRALSTRQSLRWAERAAREGDYDGALGWLSTIERAEGLDEHWQAARKIWTARAAQVAQPDDRSGR